MEIPTLYNRVGASFRGVWTLYNPVEGSDPPAPDMNSPFDLEGSIVKVVYVVGGRETVFTVGGEPDFNKVTLETVTTENGEVLATILFLLTPADTLKFRKKQKGRCYIDLTDSGGFNRPILQRDLEFIGKED